MQRVGFAAKPAYPTGAVLAQAFARTPSGAGNYRPQNDPAAAGINTTAKTKYERTLDMWAAGGVSTPPLVYQQGDGTQTIPYTSGEMPLQFSLAGKTLKVECYNGSVDNDFQEGIYIFKNQSGGVVFGIRTYRNGNYSSRIKYALPDGSGNAVWYDMESPSNYGNDYVNFTFTENSVSATSSGGANNMGSLSPTPISVGDIAQFYANVSAVARIAGPNFAYTYIMCL